MTDTSLLDTPLVFEIPCCFTNSQATLALNAFLEEKTQDGYTLPLTTEKLFDLKLQNLTYIDEFKATYDLSPSVVSGLTKNPTAYYCEQGIFDSEDSSKSAFSFNQAWMASDPLYQLYLRYDSETGLIYIQNGSQTS